MSTFRCEQYLPGEIKHEELWKAKNLFESGYHPETGERITGIARPPAHVPMNSLLAGGMMASYQIPLGVVLWHWLNQTYNAVMAYAYKDDESPITDAQLMTSCGLATGTAIGTALGLNSLMRCSPYLLARFVPLAAVAAAHCISVPLMRAQYAFSHIK